MPHTHDNEYLSRLHGMCSAAPACAELDVGREARATAKLVHLRPPGIDVNAGVAWASSFGSGDSCHTLLSALIAAEAGAPSAVHRLSVNLLATGRRDVLDGKVRHGLVTFAHALPYRGLTAAVLHWLLAACGYGPRLRRRRRSRHTYAPSSHGVITLRRVCEAPHAHAAH